MPKRCSSYLMVLAIAACLLAAGCGGKSGSAGQVVIGETVAPAGPVLVKAAGLVADEDFQDASLFVTAARQKAPEDLDAVRATAYVYLKWGQATSGNRERQTRNTRLQTAARFATQVLRAPNPVESDYEVAIEIQLAFLNGNSATDIAEVGRRRYPDSVPLALLHAKSLNWAGRYAEALTSITETLERNPDSVDAMWRQAFLYACLGDYAASVEGYEKAAAASGDDAPDLLMEEFERVRLMLNGPLEEPRFWAHYTSGTLHAQVGRQDRCGAECAAALRVLEAMRAQGKELKQENAVWFEAQASEHAATGLKFVGARDAAKIYQARAVELYKKSGYTYQIAHSMHTLALRTIDCAHQYPQDDPRQKEFLKEAESILKEALDFCDKTRNTHTRRHVLANLVETMERLEKGSSADTSYREQLQFELPPEGPNGDCSLEAAAHTIADVALFEDDFQTAACYYEWVMAEGKYDKNLDLIHSNVSTATNMVRCYKELGAVEKVTKQGEVVLDYADLLRKRLSDDEARRGILGPDVTRAITLASSAYLELQRPEDALRMLERYKGRALLALLAGKAFAPGLQSEQTPMADAAADVQAQKPASTLPDLATLEGFTFRNFQLEETAVKRLQEDTRVSKRAISSLGESLVASTDELRSMAKDFTFVSYLFDDKQGLAVVLNADGVVGVPLPALQSAPLLALLEQLRDAYAPSQAEVRDLEIEAKLPADQTAPATPGKHPAEALYDMLIAPLLPHVRHEVLYLSTDGNLNYLPFDLLQRDGRYLVEDYAIVQAPSATFLKWLLDHPKPARNTVLAMGNPSLNNPAFRLVNAGAEAQAVRGLFSAGDLKLETEATETSVYALAPKADVLHFACHGEINYDNPMLSSLRLAPDAANDGYLHAGEVFDLSLQPSLVVLSACNTGAGKVTSGNELMGLTRSFFYAGAKSIVSSLWFVDDRSTSELMQAFYRNLNSMSTAEALRQAKLEVKGKYPDPIHWAPFTLQGDFR